MGITKLRGADLWAAPSRSRPGMTHLVRVVGGRYTCSCEHFQYHRRCRHVTDVDALPQRPDQWGDVRACPECGASRMAFELRLPLRCLSCEWAAGGRR